jgi:hypothetical protein
MVPEVSVGVEAVAAVVEAVAVVVAVAVAVALMSRRQTLIPRQPRWQWLVKHQC